MESLWEDIGAGMYDISSCHESCFAIFIHNKLYMFSPFSYHLIRAFLIRIDFCTDSFFNASSPTKEL